MIQNICISVSCFKYLYLYSAYIKINFIIKIMADDSLRLINENDLTDFYNIK